MYTHRAAAPIARTYFSNAHLLPKVKTSFWQLLPWCLCALALPDEEDARAAGRDAVAQWEAAAGSTVPTTLYGVGHRMSQRLLDPHFVGTEGDVALRPSLDERLCR